MLLNGEPQEITDTAEFTYDTVKGADAESLDFSFTVVSKGVLNTLIDYAETLDEEVAGAVPSVQEKFEKALAEAKTVSETVAVTQQQIIARCNPLPRLPGRR